MVVGCRRSLPLWSSVSAQKRSCLPILPSYARRWGEIIEASPSPSSSACGSTVKAQAHVAHSALVCWLSVALLTAGCALQRGEADTGPSHEQGQLESSISRTVHEADGRMVGCPAACCHGSQMQSVLSGLLRHAHVMECAAPVQAASQASAPGPSYQQSAEAAADRVGAPQQQAFIEAGRIPPEWLPAPNLGPSSYIVPSRNPGGALLAATAVCSAAQPRFSRGRRASRGDMRSLDCSGSDSPEDETLSG